MITSYMSGFEPVSLLLLLLLQSAGRPPCVTAGSWLCRALRDRRWGSRFNFADSKECNMSVDNISWLLHEYY